MDTNEHGFLSSDCGPMIRHSVLRFEVRKQFQKPRLIRVHPYLLSIKVFRSLGKICGFGSPHSCISINSNLFRISDFGFPALCPPGID